MVYTSNATSRLGQDDVFSIVQNSVTNNMSRDITGFLIYADSRFLQLIEGEEGNLRGLLATLRTDPRHENIDILIDEPVNARRFPRWRMQRVAKGSGSAEEIRNALTSGAGGRTTLRQVDRFLA